MRRVLIPVTDDDGEIPPVRRRAGWLATTSGLTKDRARALLARRWRDLDKPLIGLRDRLLSSEPVAIVEGFGPPMLELLRKPPAETERPRETTYLVRPPTTRSAVRQSLAARKIVPDPLLVAFLAAFDGLRDYPVNPLPSPGNFVPHDRWKSFDRYIDKWHKEGLDESPQRRWAEYFTIYESPSGDHLLYSRNGRMGWFNSPEGRYEPEWRSFRSFLRFYTNFQDWFQPLDSYATWNTRPD